MSHKADWWPSKGRENLLDTDREGPVIVANLGETYVQQWTSVEL